jgi:hypothetical protein
MPMLGRRPRPSSSRTTMPEILRRASKPEPVPRRLRRPPRLTLPCCRAARPNTRRERGRIESLEPWNQPPRGVLSRTVPKVSQRPNYLTVNRLRSFPFRKWYSFSLSRFARFEAFARNRCARGALVAMRRAASRNWPTTRCGRSGAWPAGIRPLPHGRLSDRMVRPAHLLEARDPRNARPARSAPGTRVASSDSRDDRPSALSSESSEEPRCPHRAGAESDPSSQRSSSAC